MEECYRAWGRPSCQCAEYPPQLVHMVIPQRAPPLQQEACPSAGHSPSLLQGSSTVLQSQVQGTPHPSPSRGVRLELPSETSALPKKGGLPQRWLYRENLQKMFLLALMAPDSKKSGKVPGQPHVLVGAGGWEHCPPSILLGLPSSCPESEICYFQGTDQ